MKVCCHLCTHQMLHRMNTFLLRMVLYCNLFSMLRHNCFPVLVTITWTREFFLNDDALWKLIPCVVNCIFRSSHPIYVILKAYHRLMFFVSKS